jgi:hypothetical protein
MKKLIILLTVLSISFISCKKYNVFTAGETENLSLENATVVMTGKLSYPSEISSGSVNIYRQSNGNYVLGLEQMNLNAGTSFVVYLSTSTTVSSSSVKIFSVKNLNGNVFHILPNDIDFTAFKYLIIETEPSEEIVASAELS